MSILFVDGFDYCTDDTLLTAGARQKYDNLTRAQSSIVDGRQHFGTTTGGHAWNFGSVPFASSAATKVFPRSSTWFIGMNFQVTGGGAPGTGTWFRFESAPPTIDEWLTNSATQLSILIDADNRFQFFTGGDGTFSNYGTLIAHPAFVFTPGQWFYLELKVKFGPHGSIEMHVDDVRQYLDGNINVGVDAVTRLTRFWQNFGIPSYSVDDLYYANDSAGQDFLGPCRVTVHFPLADQLVSGWSRSMADTITPFIADIYPTIGTPSELPDGDATFTAGSAPDSALLRFAALPCYGRILALALNASMRLESGTPSVQLIGRPDPRGVTVLYGPTFPAQSAYTITQAVSASPGAGFWNDAQIGNGFWGFTAAGGGVLRVTSFFLEKLTSLRAVPYNCGQSSYAF